MSHFSRLKTKLRDKDVLIQSLSEMGFSIRNGGRIRGYEGEHEVDLAVETAGGFGIGFVEAPDGTFDMVADSWAVGGRKQQKVLTGLERTMERIQQEYAVKSVLAQTEREGYELVEQVQEENGTVRIVVRRWV